MQCPKCSYEPTMAEMQQSPADCTQCGINYVGFKQAQAKAAEAKAAQQKLSPQVRHVERDFNGAQPVVVIGIQMGFFQWMRLMVKVVLASIPAMLIVAFILFLLGSLFAGLIGGAAYFGSKAVGSNSEYSLSRSQLLPDSVALAVVSKDGVEQRWLIDCAYGTWKPEAGGTEVEAPQAIGRQACIGAPARVAKFR